MHLVAESPDGLALLTFLRNVNKTATQGGMKWPTRLSVGITSTKDAIDRKKERVMRIGESDAGRACEKKKEARDFVEARIYPDEARAKEEKSR